LPFSVYISSFLCSVWGCFSDFLSECNHFSSFLSSFTFLAQHVMPLLGLPSEGISFNFRFLASPPSTSQSVLRLSFVSYFTFLLSCSGRLLVLPSRGYLVLVSFHISPFSRSAWNILSDCLAESFKFRFIFGLCCVVREASSSDYLLECIWFLFRFIS
jgi:hypothetical protein